MKHIPVATCLLILLFSCVSTQNRYLESIGEHEKAALQDLDLSLLQFTVNGDDELLTRVETRVTSLLKGELPSKEYKAELLGLLGLAQYYDHNTAGAAKTAALIEKESSAQCRLYLIKALLMKDEKKQITYLEESLPKAGEKGPLLLFLAERYFKAGDYRRALAAYDESLPTLHPRYREVYQQHRDLAFQFIDHPQVKVETRDLIAKNTLSFNDFLILTLRETRYLETVTADTNTPPAALLSQLKARGYIRNEVRDLQEPVTRGQVAYFLVRVLSILENDASLPEKYAGAVRAGSRSPVPDVATSDYFYTAVLVLVERELMNLPDGKNFQPYGTVGGADYFEILRRFKNRYGS